MDKKKLALKDDAQSSRPFLLIFTDLDGTLLDQEDYAFDHARPTLKRIRDLAMPLIVTTSKTRSEVQLLLQKLKLNEPFITENGGGVFFPCKYRDFNIKDACAKDIYQCLCLGRPYEAIRSFICHEIKDRMPVRGFGDMSVREVAALTNLSHEEAAQACCREFTEPLLIENPDDVPRVIRLAENVGLTLAKGDRFYHLMDQKQDKGKAVRLVTDIFHKHLGKEIRTIGLGNSRNDLPMLENVDIPVLIPYPDGHYEDTGLANLLKAPYPGSRGWNSIVEDLLNDLT
ncbi:MAG: HAD-IIB family hydrolase [Syntrophaceae bacterium]|nr:HAD-IIB family hydrolase [Syntrophaceae bacterium]